MLIAAVGFAGAGKTTSLAYLASIGAGTYYYVGGIVRDEVITRGLELNPQNERAVREDLRVEFGMAALAERAASEIGHLLAAGACVLIDAICNQEEARFYRNTFGVALKVVAIETHFDVRAGRLAVRPSRPMLPDQLLERDRYETEALSIRAVIAEADARLSNDGTEDALRQELRGLSSTFAS